MEKAFYHCFLLQVLQKFEFDGNFIPWIKPMLKDPRILDH